MQRLVQRIRNVATRDAPHVLISGETGTGKELVAKLLHASSPRCDKPLITYNCACAEGSLVQDTLFGHEKGAFTDAREAYPGLFEQADGGMLLLDEVAKMPLVAQGMLLRMIEDGKIRRLGGRFERQVNVTVLAATNRNLPQLVREEKFLPDLYERLRPVKVDVPALREHISDIREIADRYWVKLTGEHLSQEQILALEAYDYPGNVRELIGILEEAYYACEPNFEQLIDERNQDRGRSIAPRTFVSAEEFLKAYVKEAFVAHGRSYSRTAQALRLSRPTVKKYVEG